MYTTDIFIGFALPSTTYLEVEADYIIQIIKGAGNVTEKTISFVVNLFQNAPEGLGNANPSADGEDNDFSFPSSIFQLILPEENDTFVTDLTIFADALPEVTEAAQLRLSLPPTDGMYPVFKILPQYPEFFIIIEDNDGKLIISTVSIIITFQDSSLALRTPRTELTKRLECWKYA